MNVEFSQYETEVVLAIHASNGAILGTGKTKERALFSATQAIAKAWRELGYEAAAHQITIAAERVVAEPIGDQP